MCVKNLEDCPITDISIGLIEKPTAPAAKDPTPGKKIDDAKKTDDSKGNKANGSENDK